MQTKFKSLAAFINYKLGYNLYNEELSMILSLNKISKKEIKENMLDDLILENNRPSPRLIKFSQELLNDYLKGI